jgi:hypothetical protein
MIVKETFVKLTVKSARLVYIIHNRVANWGASEFIERDPSRFVTRPHASPRSHFAPVCTSARRKREGPIACDVAWKSRVRELFRDPALVFPKSARMLAKFLARYAGLTFELQMRVSIRA